MAMLRANDVYRFTAGNFENFEAIIASVAAHEVVVRLNIFGRPVERHFPLQEFLAIAEPFSDVAPSETVDNVGQHISNLRNAHPEADAVYATHWRGFPVCGSIALSRNELAGRLVVRRLNMTTPLFNSDNWRTILDHSVPLRTWDELQGLVEASAFWTLSHDYGCRFPSGKKAHRYHFEGWDGEQYHAVARQTLAAENSISQLCRFLATLAPNSGYES